MRDAAKQKGWASAGTYYSEMARPLQTVYDAVGRSYPSVGAASQGTRDVENPGFAEKYFSWAGYKASDATAKIRAALAGLTTVINKIGEVTKDGVVKAPAGSAAADNTSIATVIDKAPWYTNPLLSVAQLLFGDAFAKMMDTPSLNPMSQLINAGGSILDRATNFLTAYAVIQSSPVLGAAGGLLVGGVPGFLIGAKIGQILQALGGVLWLFVITGLAAGIVLFYVLPLMPFMYFFYSVVNWVIEVAEAFVCAPLFALAHLRIDGEGLPGQTAYAGWLTLFGVMLRPLLIVIGFIVGSLIFGAGSYYLTSLYKYAIFAYRPDTPTGAIDFEKIGAFGILMYLVLYVYLNYILANSTFKLCDMIPDKAMRWIGGNQPFTGDKPVDIGNMQSMALAGYAGVTQAKGAIEGTMSGFGKAAENLNKLRPGLEPTPRAKS